MSLTPEQMALFARLAATEGLVSSGVQDEPRSDAPLEFPMTDVQRAYWIGRTAGVELGGVASHGYQEFDCGWLDIPQLSMAWDKVITRHDMLRATVTQNGTFIVQPAVPAYHWEVDDFRKLPAEARQQALEQKRQRLSHRIPDLDKWPVLWMGASLIDDDCVRIHLSCDAVMADVYSLGICLRELGFFYQYPQEQIPPPAMTFGQYMEEQQQKEQTPFFKACEAFWLGRVAGFPEAPRLPVAEKMPVTQRFRRLQGMLPQADWSNFKISCSQYAITPSVALYAAFSAIIGQWASKSNFCLNVTLFNRESGNKGIEQVVGDFTNTMLTASRAIYPTESFVEYLAALNAEFWNDLEHSQYSGIRVLQAISEQQKRSVLMPIVFTSALGAGDVGKILDIDNGVLGKPVYTITQTPQIWLDHQALEDNGSLVFNWEVVDGIFDAGVLDAMFESYLRLLHRLAEQSSDWSQPLYLPLPPDQQERRESSLPQFEYAEKLLHQGFLEHVVRSPNAVALVAPDRTLTYGELYHAAASVARALKKIVPADTSNVMIAVGLPKCWQQIAAVLGVVFTGAAYVPVDPDWPIARREAIIKQGVMAAVVETSETSEAWFNVPVFSIEGSAAARNSGKSVRIECGQPVVADSGRFVERDCEQPVAVDCEQPAVIGGWPEDVLDEIDSFQNFSAARLAYVIFTSGTTGVPKGVMMTHEAVQNTNHDINTRFGINLADSVFALAALTFDLSVYDIFGILGVGGKLVLPAADEIRNPAAWLKRMQETPVTIWNSVPMLWQMFVEYGQPVANMPRLALLSGDWIPSSLPLESYQFSACTKLVSLGGATEAAIWSIAYEISAQDPPPQWRSIPYGRALTYQSMSVLHDDLSDCPDNVTGEIYIGGKGLALGYLGDSTLTSEKFVTHPLTGGRLYRTGDLGRWRSNGQIEFLGRCDTQVKVGGIRIELGDIEAALVALPGVTAAVVVVKEIGGRSDTLVGYIVPESMAHLPKPDELRSSLKKVLPSYMVPQQYVFLEKMPLSVNGKVDRKSLPAPSHKESLANLETGTALESQIKNIIASHIGHSAFALDEKFFDLGVTSLLMVKIHRDLNQVLPRQIALIQLFEAPNVRALARMLEGGQESGIGKARMQAEKRLAARTGQRRERGNI